MLKNSSTRAFSERSDLFFVGCKLTIAHTSHDVRRLFDGRECSNDASAGLWKVFCQQDLVICGDRVQVREHFMVLSTCAQNAISPTTGRCTCSC